MLQKAGPEYHLVLSEAGSCLVTTMFTAGLADLVGVDSFVTLMAEKLDVPVARITNTNSIRDVRRCIRDRYHISKHHGGRVPGLCGKCTPICCRSKPNSAAVVSSSSCIALSMACVKFLSKIMGIWE